MNFIPEVLEAVRATRSISLPLWGKITPEAFKGDSPASVVTRIDTEIETYLAGALAAIEPTITFVGEEFGGDRLADTFWLCDPIDGTGHYVRGTPFATTMLALIDKGEVTFSAIYDFVTDTMYHAVKGGGAWENSTRITVSNRNTSNAYILYETKLDKPENMAKYLQLRTQSNLLSFVCAGYEHAMVAKGVFDGRICYDGYGQDYDFAPGSLLVREAGGVVANIGSESYDYRNTNYIATNPTIFENLTHGTDAIFSIGNLG